LKRLLVASLLLAALPSSQAPGSPSGPAKPLPGAKRPRASRPSEASCPFAERLADAIYIAEGGARAKWPYGVLRVKDPKKARRICLQIIETESQVYDRLLEQGLVEVSFIEHLGARYCPPHANKLNKNWVKNTGFWFRKLSPP
jgi:hypothetical protein